MRPILIAFALALTGCASDRQPAAPAVAMTLPSQEFHAVSVGAEVYRIGPADKLALRVMQAEELSFEEIFVDAGGYLELPLIGSVRAAGLTAAELSDKIESELGMRYMRDPQVIVTVAEAASQKVTLDGAVTKPGVYEMRGRTTLLQAVSMAEGPTRVADLSSVAVFRSVDSRPMVAVFDLRAIRAGQSPDPVIRGDDVIVVDTSRLTERMQFALQALPSLASFFYYSR